MGKGEIPKKIAAQSEGRLPAKPVWGLLIGGLELIFVVVTFLSLTKFGWKNIPAQIGVHGFTLGAFFCLLLFSIPFALLFPWAWLGLMTGHVMGLLSALGYLVNKDQFSNFSLSNNFFILIYHVSGITVLMIPPVYKQYAFPNMRHWIRAKRHDVQIQGTLFFGPRTAEIKILNLSSSGCLFVSQAAIPISEICRLDFFHNQKFRAKIVVQRAFSTDATNLTNYGASFPVLLTSNQVRDLLNLQTDTERPWSESS